MEGFQAMEVRPSNGRIAFHYLERANFYSLVSTRFNTLICMLDAHDNSVKVINSFQLSVDFNCTFCESTADFHKFNHYYKLSAQNDV